MSKPILVIKVNDVAVFNKKHIIEQMPQPIREDYHVMLVSNNVTVQVLNGKEIKEMSHDDVVAWVETLKTLE